MRLPKPRLYLHPACPPATKGRLARRNCLQRSSSILRKAESNRLVGTVATASYLERTSAGSWELGLFQRCMSSGVDSSLARVGAEISLRLFEQTNLQW